MDFNMKALQAQRISIISVAIKIRLKSTQLWVRRPVIDR